MIAAELRVSDNVRRYLRRIRQRSEMHRALLLGGAIVVTEARRILTRNGHIITGNLRRDIRTESTAPLKVLVGSHVAYAYFVEMLPDGGFLRPAVRRTADDVADFVAARLAEVRRR